MDGTADGSREARVSGMRPAGTAASAPFGAAFFVSVLLLLAGAPGEAQGESPRQPDGEGAHTPGAATQQRKEQKEIEKEREIERTLEQKKQELKGLKKEEGSLLETLQQLDVRVGEMHQAQTTVEAEIRELEASGAALDSRMRETAKKRDSFRREVDARLLALYKASKGGAVEMLAGSRSSAELARSVAYLKYLVNHDTSILETYRSSLLESNRENDLLEKTRIDLEIRRIDLRAKTKALESEKETKAAVLARLQGEKETRLRLISELERSKEKLRGLVRSLETPATSPAAEPPSAKAGRTGFAERRGKLAFPVSGSVLSLFGKVQDPKYHTLTFNQGIVIGARLGDEIRCVHGGKVAYAGTFPGYGNLMIVDHGDGFFTVYAHLSEVLKTSGSPIRQAEVLGQVGDTGSVAGPCLYFEIRRHGVAVDPLQWLSRPVARRKGRKG